MADDLRGHGADLRGINRLSLAGIAGVVDLVEAMHYNIASVPGIRAKPRRDRTTGITRLVYQSIRGVVGIVEYGLEKMLARLDPLLGERSTWPGREALLAALNGVRGDYLASSRVWCAPRIHGRCGTRYLRTACELPCGSTRVQANISWR